jgi:hypothetical protein
MFHSSFFYITYINSVRTSQETQYISVLQPASSRTRATEFTFFFGSAHKLATLTSLAEGQGVNLIMLDKLEDLIQREDTLKSVRA